MEPALTSARHFARLVWLLLHEPANVDEQKATLRALVLATRECALSLASDDQLLSSGTVVPPAFAGVTDVMARMSAHGLRGVDTDTSAGPAELLGVARLLAGPETPGDFGAGATRLLAGMDAPHVRLTVRPNPGAMPELELLDTPAEAPERASRPSRAVAPGGDSRQGGPFDQFGALPATSATPQQLLAELAAASDSSRLDHLVDYLVEAAERALADNKPVLVGEIMLGLVQRDAAATDATDKRILALGLRKLAKGPVLQAIARQLPRSPERREALMAVLARMGDDGADALIEQLATASQQSDRRAYFDALVRLQAGVPTLIHMLGDTRWFVARNAADLLGEMQAKEAEQPLTWLLQNADDRVRRSATAALMRLGTPRALQAIHDALRDPVSQVRMQAAAALVTRQDMRTATALVKALDVEKDEEVQDAFLIALGRIGTPDAVKRLIAAAEPERGLFRSKRSGLRVAAVQGLAEAKSAEAVSALNALTADKEAEVRDAATFALGKIARQGKEPLSAP